MDRQLKGTTICAAVSSGLLVSFKDANDSYCVRTKMQNLQELLAWRHVGYAFGTNFLGSCFSCTSKASLYGMVYFKDLRYSFYVALIFNFNSAVLYSESFDLCNAQVRFTYWFYFLLRESCLAGSCSRSLMEGITMEWCVLQIYALVGWVLTFPSKKVLKQQLLKGRLIL